SCPQTLAFWNHRLEFQPADITEVFEWIITTIEGPQLNLLGRQVRFTVSVDDFSYDFFSRRQYSCGGTQPNPIQECIHWNQIPRVVNQIFWIVCIMLRSVDKEACTFADKIGIERLTEDKLSSQQFASILMPLRYPGA